MFKRRLLNSISGKVNFQPFWEKLYCLSLQGMNIGNGASIKESGEIWLLRHIDRLINPSVPLVIFDVGANVGDYTVAVKSEFGSRAKVFCFEPSNRTYKRLIDNLGNRENVEPYNFGLSNEEGELSLFSDKENSGLASVYKRRLDHFEISMEQCEKITLKTLDGFCSENRINHINLLKLDVEGHELKVLQGAEILIRTAEIDFIQFEFGGCNIDSKTFFQDFYYLLNPYYKLYRVLKDGLAPINSYKETNEIFITTNFLAISRRIIEK